MVEILWKNFFKFSHLSKPALAAVTANGGGVGCSAAAGDFENLIVRAFWISLDGIGRESVHPSRQTPVKAIGGLSTEERRFGGSREMISVTVLERRY